jgi:hypothetical protein
MSIVDGMHTCLGPVHSMPPHWPHWGEVSEPPVLVGFAVEVMGDGFTGSWDFVRCYTVSGIYCDVTHSKPKPF